MQKTVKGEAPVGIQVETAGGHASQGIGLISTFLALFVATLFPNGLHVNGVTAWILATLIVWLITALGTWILGALIIDRWWQKRQQTQCGPGRRSGDDVSLSLGVCERALERFPSLVGREGVGDLDERDGPC